MKVQVAVLPLPSVAVYVIVVAPSGKVLPLTGPAVCVIVAPLQLSLTVGAVQEAVAVHAAPAFTVMFAGQLLIVGAVTSTTVTVKVQVAVLPLPSVAVYVTVVVPSAKALPLAGPAVCVIVAPGQLSVPVGADQVATAVHAAPAFKLWFAGQPTIVGACVSFTVTVILQLAV